MDAYDSRADDRAGTGSCLRSILAGNGSQLFRGESGKRTFAAAHQPAA